MEPISEIQTTEEIKIAFLELVRSSIVRDQYKKTDTITPAISTITYNGTKSSLDIALGNVTSDKKLRQFGLLHTLPMVLKNVVQLFDEEKLGEAKEIVITHNTSVLIRCENTGCNGSVVFTLDVEQVTSKMCEKNIFCPTLTKRKLMTWFRTTDLRERTDQSRLRNFFVVCVVSFSFGLLAYFNSENAAAAATDLQL